MTYSEAAKLAGIAVTSDHGDAPVQSFGLN